jgi:DNA gyrase subunit A
MKEPSLLPTAFPNVLVSANMGIAVGMASQICGFNLGEVCETTINYLRDPDCDIMQTLTAPDFTTGGEILYNINELSEINSTGRGSFKVPLKWRSSRKKNILTYTRSRYTTYGRSDNAHKVAP